MKYIQKIILLGILVFTSSNVFAGDILVEKVLPESDNIRVGDEILVNLWLDSEGVVYNAVEGEVVVASNFDILKVITGNSLVSVWLENPVDFVDNKIRFSGIAPAGYNNASGSVFSMVLKANKAGRGNIDLKDLSIFRNNGEGTREDIADKTLALSIKELSSETEPYLISVKDTTPPEEFSVELVRDPNMFDGKYVLVFRASDKGSGVRSYDVVEGKRIFKQVKSPYELENQNLNGKIKVIAYDYENNGRIEEIVPEGKICIGYKCFGKGSIIAIAGVFMLMMVVIWKKLRK